MIVNKNKSVEINNESDNINIPNTNLNDSEPDSFQVNNNDIKLEFSSSLKKTWVPIKNETKPQPLIKNKNNKILNPHVYKSVKSPIKEVTEEEDETSLNDFTGQK